MEILPAEEQPKIDSKGKERVAQEIDREFISQGMKVQYHPGFIKDLDRLFGWRWAPYRWLKAVLYFPTDIKHFLQRGRRGWADCDVWGMNSYLLRIIPPMIREMRSYAHGHPVSEGIKTQEDWLAILDRMAYGLERMYAWEEDYCEVMGVEKPNFDDPEFKKRFKETRVKINDEFQTSLGLFKKYFLNLWD